MLSLIRWRHQNGWLDLSCWIFINRSISRKVEIPVLAGHALFSAAWAVAPNHRKTLRAETYILYHVYTQSKTWPYIPCLTDCIKMNSPIKISNNSLKLESSEPNNNAIQHSPWYKMLVWCISGTQNNSMTNIIAWWLVCAARTLPWLKGDGESLALVTGYDYQSCAHVQQSFRAPHVLCLSSW